MAEGIVEAEVSFSGEPDDTGSNPASPAPSTPLSAPLHDPNTAPSTAPDPESPPPSLGVRLPGDIGRVSRPESRQGGVSEDQGGHQGGFQRGQQGGLGADPQELLAAQAGLGARLERLALQVEGIGAVGGQVALLKYAVSSLQEQHKVCSARFWGQNMNGSSRDFGSTLVLRNDRSAGDNLVKWG